MENVPADGGALILYYHGALPIDYYYFVAKERGIQMYCASMNLNISF